MTAGPLRVSQRARGIHVSPTVAVAQRAAEMRAGGIDVLDFSVGEPDQPTPAHVVRAAQEALAAGSTRYTNTLGLPALRSAVAHRYREDHGLDVAAGNVAITLGGKHAIYATCQVLLDPGDEVVVPVPSWPTLAEAVRLAGGVVVPAVTSAASGFRLQADAVTRVMTAKTRAVFVNNPSNPAGTALHPAELLKLGELARARGVALLLDDTYARLWFAAPPAGGPLRELQERAGDQLVILGTTSKSYCMTGWRIGWIVGPAALVRTCGAYFSHSTQHAATFAQLAAVEALTGPQDHVRELTALLRHRRDVVLGALARIPGVRCEVPDGAFYVFPDVSARLGRAGSTLDLCAGLLETERVALVPGEGFGVPGHVRLSLARPLSELEEGLVRIDRYLSSLEA